MKGTIREEFGNSISPILRGIFSDLHVLIHQEIALVKSEARHEAMKIIAAAALLVLSALGVMSATLLFTLSFVFFALWAIPSLLLWESFMITAIIMSCVSYIFFRQLKKKIANTNISLPKSRQALKEMTYVQ